ncbi:MAG: hypothetical protein AAFU64_03375 [Bacteroidota bacterium]
MNGSRFVLAVKDLAKSAAYYIDVKNIQELFEEYQAKEIEILSDLKDQSWGQREFAIPTIDGHRIRFGETLES